MTTAAVPAPHKQAAPRLGAVPADQAALVAALRAQVAMLQGCYDVLAAQHREVLGRTALAEWRLTALEARIGKLPTVPDHLREFVTVELVDGGARHNLNRAALMTAAAEGRLG